MLDAVCIVFVLFLLHSWRGGLVTGHIEADCGFDSHSVSGMHVFIIFFGFKVIYNMGENPSVGQRKKKKMKKNIQKRERQLLLSTKCKV